MEYRKIQEGVFLNRPNRFVAHVLIEGKEEIVHVKNTGRCRELLVPGARVFLEEGDNPKRKTKYSLVAVYKGKLLVNMDSQAPNAVVAEALAEGRIEELGTVDVWKREVRFSHSRFDFYFEKGDTKGFMEVKGVTLEEAGVTRFPDAPTTRGTRHLEELILAKEMGYEAIVLFVVQMEGMKEFLSHWERDPSFANTLEKAKEKGVRVLVYQCHVWEKGLELAGKLAK